MFDTHAVARSLTDAELTPAQADAITNAVRLAAEQGDHVTSDQFKSGLAEVRAEISNLDTRLSTQVADLRAEQRTGLAEVRTEIASLDTRLSTEIAGVRTEVAGVRTEIGNLETRLIKWIVGTVIATAGVTAAIAGAVVGVLRLLSTAPVP